MKEVQKKKMFIVHKYHIYSYSDFSPQIILTFVFFRCFQKKQLYYNMQQEESIQIPAQFICPLSKTIMKEPAVISDGTTFQKEEIQKWFESHDTNPISKVKLDNLFFFPNQILKSLIQDFQTRSGKSFSELHNLSSIQNIPTHRTWPMPSQNGEDQQKHQLRMKFIKFEENWVKFEFLYKKWLYNFEEEIQKYDTKVQFPDGFFAGQIFENKRHGIGYMKYSEGHRFWGQWKDDEKQGYGQLQLNNLVIFGEWKNDKLNGLGWVSISKNYALMLYKGEWENNMKKGVGVEYNPAKKQTYVGEWKNGFKHGKSIVKCDNNTIQYNIWDHGEMVKSDQDFRKQFLNNKTPREQSEKASSFNMVSDFSESEVISYVSTQRKRQSFHLKVDKINNPYYESQINVIISSSAYENEQTKNNEEQTPNLKNKNEIDVQEMEKDESENKGFIFEQGKKRLGSSKDHDQIVDYESAKSPSKKQKFKIKCECQIF